LRSSPYLSDALVVGTDRPRLGLLLFPRLPLPRITDILDLISPLLVQANQTSPSFAQISKEMCLVVKKIGLLPKSSKGTVQRGLAYEVFRKEIERLYDNPIEQYAGEKRSLLEIEDCLHGLIMEVMGSSRKVVSLDRITDLFSWGVDSLMATRIRSGIHRVSLAR